MPSAFANLKKSRQSHIAKLQDQLEKSKSGPRDNDLEKSFWKLVPDKVGNGSAIIRFLPGPEGESDYVREWSYAFKGPTGKWYIERSPKTIGQEDPVFDYNAKLWERGDKDEARKQRRALKYVTNILVMKHPGNPEDEGKVFRWKFGKSIFQMIQDRIIAPEDLTEDEIKEFVPINAYDMWEGAPLNLKVRKKDGFPNYEKSSWGETGPVAKTDKEMEAIYAQVMSLNELNAPDQFKPYDQLKKRLDFVLGLSVAARDDSEQQAAPSAGKQRQSKAELSDDEGPEDYDKLFNSLASEED